MAIIRGTTFADTLDGTGDDDDLIVADGVGDLRARAADGQLGRIRDHQR